MVWKHEECETKRLPVRKYSFLDSFLFGFVYKIFAVTIEYHCFNWKDVSASNVDMFEKEQLYPQFFLVCVRCLQRIRLFALLTAENGNGAGV